MIGRTALLLFGVASLLAAQDTRAVFQAAIDALSARKPEALWLLFDAKTPAYKQLRKDTQALLDGFDVTASVTFLDGDRSSWTLQMTGRGGVRSHTTRTAEVTAKVVDSHIVSFVPERLFAPPDPEAAWEVITAASSALANESFDNPELAVKGASVQFFAGFDRATPGLEQLRATLASLARDYHLESEVELTANEGGDTERTLTMDWQLNLISRSTDATVRQRRMTIVCRMKKEGAKWRVVSFDPLTLFAPV